MKKIIFILFAMFAFAISSNAQIEQKNYAGSSRFTDNVSVTLQGGILTPFEKPVFGDKTIPAIVLLGADKYLTPWFGLGLEGRTAIGTGSGIYNMYTAFDAVNVSGYAKFNVLNMIKFNGNRRLFEPVVYTGVGWGHTTCSLANRRNYMTYRSGVELNVNLGKTRSWGVVVNPAVVWGDINNGKLMKSHGSFEITAGVVYHFKTSNKKNHMTAVVPVFNEIVREVEKPVVQEVEKVVEKTVTNVEYVQNTYVVPFAFNSSVLTDEAKETLDKVSGTVCVVAYASPEGSKTYNKALSQKRANVVRDYLEGKGVKVENATGMGTVNDTSNRIAIVTLTYSHT